jgi:hypothetical protein
VHIGCQNCGVARYEQKINVLDPDSNRSADPDPGKLKLFSTKIKNKEISCMRSSLRGFSRVLNVLRSCSRTHRYPHLIRTFFVIKNLGLDPDSVTAWYGSGLGKMSGSRFS